MNLHALSLVHTLVLVLGHAIFLCIIPLTFYPDTFLLLEICVTHDCLKLGDMQWCHRHNYQTSSTWLTLPAMNGSRLAAVLRHCQVTATRVPYTITVIQCILWGTSCTWIFPWKDFSGGYCTQTREVIGSGPPNKWEKTQIIHRFQPSHLLQSCSY